MMEKFNPGQFIVISNILYMEKAADENKVKFIDKKRTILILHFNEKTKTYIVTSTTSGKMRKNGKKYSPTNYSMKSLKFDTFINFQLIEFKEEELKIIDKFSKQMNEQELKEYFKIF